MHGRGNLKTEYSNYMFYHRISLLRPVLILNKKIRGRGVKKAQRNIIGKNVHLYYIFFF